VKYPGEIGEFSSLIGGIQKSPTYKIETGKDFFRKAQKAIPALILAVFSRLFDHFNRFWQLNMLFLSSLDRKLYKFDKKVIALEKLDDYHNEFGYKD
jgi:hypothetical protein